MRKYRLVAKKGEGTFSEVLKAQNVKDGKYHAIKCMKNRFDSIDQVNNLREIQALRRLSPNEHIITLEEVLYDQPTGRLALVFELMDANLYELIRGRRHYLNPQLIKGYMWQLMQSLDHMHKKGIFHRDIKPENILIENSTEIGRGLKLADFGSCRGIYSKQPYTEYISTRWYRAPECLLTNGYYGPEMDLWGAGCVMFEITSLFPLFPGNNEVDQITKIHKVLGTPGKEMLDKFKSKGESQINFDFVAQAGCGIPHFIPHASPDALDLMISMLKYDAADRITSREAMRHPYFKEFREAEAQKHEKQAMQESNGQSELLKQQLGNAPMNGSESMSNVYNQQPNKKAGNNSTTSVNSSVQQIRHGMNEANKIIQNSGNKQQGSLAPIGNNTGKLLPTIIGNSNNSNSTVKQVGSSSNLSSQEQQQLVGRNAQLISKHYLQQQPSGNHAGKNAPIMLTPNVTGSSMKSSGAPISLFPPINGSNSNSQNTSETNKGNSQVAPGISPRKKKKYRSNFGQDASNNAGKSKRTGEQVSKAYGVPSRTTGVDSGSMIGGGAYGNNNTVASTHPNRNLFASNNK